MRDIFFINVTLVLACICISYVRLRNVCRKRDVSSFQQALKLNEEDYQVTFKAFYMFTRTHTDMRYIYIDAK